MTQTRYDQLIHGQRGLANATMRDVIIPALLGKETDGILYWIGKDLAREYPVGTTDELIVLTRQLGFGDLTQKKQTATQQLFELAGPVVSERLALTKEETSFSLEAGFLAQECEFQLGLVAEAVVFDLGRREVKILVQNDPAGGDTPERGELATFIHPLIDPKAAPAKSAKAGLFNRRKQK